MNSWVIEVGARNGLTSALSRHGYPGARYDTLVGLEN
jgi:hypothetical protein